MKQKYNLYGFTVVNRFQSFVNELLIVNKLDSFYLILSQEIIIHSGNSLENQKTKYHHCSWFGCNHRDSDCTIDLDLQSIYFRREEIFAENTHRFIGSST